MHTIDKHDYVARKLRRMSIDRSILPQMARDRLAEHRTVLTIPTTTADACVAAGFLRPTWLRPYTDALDVASASETTEICFHAPPQHGKTTATLCGLVALCNRVPSRRHLYVTYNETRAWDVQMEFLSLAPRIGVRVKKRGNCVTVYHDGKAPSTIRFTSINGSVTGYTVTGLIVIDDPVKGDDAAQSPRQKQTTWAFFVRESLTRTVHHLGTVVMMTRWAEDDLIGMLVDRGWQYIRLPAIADEDPDPIGRSLGDALCPYLHDATELRRTSETVGADVWSAMFMGTPRGSGESVFHNPTFFDTLPHTDTYVSYGLDCAYGTKSHNDWTVVVEITTDATTRRHYVTDVQRWKAQTPESLLRIRQMIRQGCKCLWVGSGTEKGTADLLRQTVPEIIFEHTNKNKSARAEITRQRWNNGQILWRRGLCQPALDTVLRFTGVGDLHDDDVDALASAMTLAERSLTSLSTFGVPRDIARKPRYV